VKTLRAFFWQTWPFEWLVRGFTWLFAPHHTYYCYGGKRTCRLGKWLPDYECPDGTRGGWGCRILPPEWTRDSLVLWDSCKECGVGYPTVKELNREWVVSGAL